MRGQTFTGNSTNISVLVDGVAPANGNTSAYGWSYSGGVLNQAAGGTGGTTGAGFAITGLTLGYHTITLTNNTTAQITISSFDVISPIHVTKSNSPYAQQNSLPVGSQGISDNRKTTPVKGLGGRTKNLVVADGIATTSTTSTSYVPLADMSATITVADNARLDISFNGTSQNNVAGGFGDYAIFVDGVQVGGNFIAQSASGGLNVIVSIRRVVTVSPGVHKVDVYWHAGGNTQTSPVDANSSRTLTVVEI